MSLLVLTVVYLRYIKPHLFVGTTHVCTVLRLGGRCIPYNSMVRRDGEDGRA